MKRCTVICAALLATAFAPAKAMPASSTPPGTEAAAQATRDGRWPEALSLWQQASARLPDDPAVAAELGWAEMSTGRTADARRDFNRAMRLDPGSLRASAGLVALSLRDFRYDDAIATAQAAVRIHPEAGSAYRVLGDAQLAASRRSEAEASYRKAVALDPNDAAAHAALGDTLMVRNKIDEAVREYRAAVRLKADSEPYRESLGRAALAGGLYGEAALSFAAAMDMARTPSPDWAKLDALALQAIDSLTRADAAIRSGDTVRQELFDANTQLLAVVDALAETPVVRDAAPDTAPDMAQRQLAYTLLGQAAASDLAALRKGQEPPADAVVFREQARRAIVQARAAAKAPAAS